MCLGAKCGYSCDIDSECVPWDPFRQAADDLLGPFLRGRRLPACSAAPGSRRGRICSDLPCAHGYPLRDDGKGFYLLPATIAVVVVRKADNAACGASLPATT
jgi:hypothetical protein